MKCLLVTVTYPNMDYDFERSKVEMVDLALACDFEIVEFVHQNLSAVTSKSFIGPGKVDEIKALLDDIDVVIFDDELSPTQLNYLSEEWNITIHDRTSIILTIFACRAKTKEAKLQVEIATYQYMLPRLVGMKSHLHGQLGGKNFRGSGEKQIELDRRVIYNQLLLASRELHEMVLHRQTQRNKRISSGVPTVALVGYTNSGKSTLMNQLVANEDKKVFAKDMLFATLETSTRKAIIQGHDIVVTDTVGFIERLPHHLIKAFRSTLEELVDADLLVHVIDSSNPNQDVHVETTKHVIDAIGGSNIPVIYAYNKIDCIQYYQFKNYSPNVYISAKEKIGFEELEEQIKIVLFKEYVRERFSIPYFDGHIFQQIIKEFVVLDTKYLDNHIEVFVEGLKYKLDVYAKYNKEIV